MSALDRFHNAVKNALIADGWTVTHDPLRLTAGRRNVYVDLGAERLLAADKGNQKIAVEIKSFMGRSEVAELEQAVGQYWLYRGLLKRQEPDRVLYMAIPKETWETLFQEVIGEVVLEEPLTHVLAYDPDTETIVEWKP